MGLGGVRVLAPLRIDAQHVAAIGIAQRERMAPASSHREFALEVHGPHVVGCGRVAPLGLLGAQHRCPSATTALDQTLPIQDAVHRAHRGHALSEPELEQPVLDDASTVFGSTTLTLHDAPPHLRAHRMGRLMWSPRMLQEPCLALFLVASQPLVKALPALAKTAGHLAHRHPGVNQINRSLLLLHVRHPSHGAIPPPPKV